MRWLERHRARRRYAERVETLVSLFEREAWAEAERTARALCDEASELFGEGAPERIAALYAASRVLFVRGQLEQAERACREALSLAQRDPPRSDPPLPDLLQQLAGILEARGADEELGALLRDAVQSYDRMRAPDPGEQSAALNRLGLWHAARGRRAEALRLYERALAVREEAFGPADPGLAEILYNAATARIEGGEPAVEALERAAALCEEEALGAKIDHNRAVALEAAGDVDGARRAYQEALAALERVHGPRDAALRPTLVRLARLDHAAGRFDAAARRYERAVALARHELGAEHEVTGRLETWLGDARSEIYR